MELDAIVDLGETEATQNLIRNFFLGDKFRKGTSKAPAERITHAAVIGSGVMGAGIAQWLSSRGVSVILRDVSAEQLDRGGEIQKTYGDAVKRGLMSEEKAREGTARASLFSTGNMPKCATSELRSKPLPKRWRSRKRSSPISR